MRNVNSEWSDFRDRQVEEFDRENSGAELKVFGGGNSPEKRFHKMFENRESLAHFQEKALNRASTNKELK